jgi:hypothetical protein
VLVGVRRTIPVKGQPGRSSFTMYVRRHVRRGAVATRWAWRRRCREKLTPQGYDWLRGSCRYQTDELRGDTDAPQRRHIPRGPGLL